MGLNELIGKEPIDWSKISDYRINVEENRITKLLINSQGLTEIPKIKDLTELKELYLWNNQLKEIPKEIGNLIHLQEF